MAACIFELTLPLGIDEPPAVLDEFIGVSLNARDGNAGAGIYARGPEGEALEFVQALSPVKEVFETAFANRKKDAQE